MPEGIIDQLPTDESGHAVQDGIVEIVESISMTGGALVDPVVKRIQIPPTGRIKRVFVSKDFTGLPNVAFSFQLQKSDELAPAPADIHLQALGETNFIDEVIDVPYTQDDTLAWLWLKITTAGTFTFDFKLLIERKVRVSVK